MKSVFVDDTGHLKTYWNIPIFLLILGAFSFLWLIILSQVFGRISYSVLQTLAKYASFIVPTSIAALITVRIFDKNSRGWFVSSLKKSGLISLLIGLSLGTAITLAFYFQATLAGDIGLVLVNNDFVLRTFLLFALVFFVSAATEEIIFRGFLLHYLERSWGVIAALIIASALFLIPHFLKASKPDSVTLFQMTEVFLAGLLYGVAFLRSRSLWLPIGLHFAHNFIPINIFGRPLDITFTNGVLHIDNGASYYWVYYPNQGAQLGLPSAIDWLMLIATYSISIGLLLLPFFNKLFRKEA